MISRKRLLSILSATLIIGSVASLGTYLLLRGNAQSNIPDNAIRITGSGNSSVATDGWDAQSTGLKVDFKKGVIPIYVYFPAGIYLDANDRQYFYLKQADAWHISMQLDMNAKLTDVVCAAGYTCQIDNSFYDPSAQAASNGVEQRVWLCANLSRQDFNTSATLMTLRVDPSTAHSGAYGRDWNVLTSAEQGECIAKNALSSDGYNHDYTNFSHDHYTYLGSGGYMTTAGGSSGSWGQTGTASGQSGGNGSAGTGNGGAGQGAGTASGTSTGGGSSANTQTDRPQSVPSASAQGTTQQPMVHTPSPFYDGKAYAPGSNPLEATANTTSVQNTAGGRAALLIIGAAFVAGTLVLIRLLRLRRKHGGTLYKHR